MKANTADKSFKTKPVEFSYHAPDAQDLFLAGTFNDWNTQATPMVEGADGNWSVVVKLSPGCHEFKFVVDGNWSCEPSCDGTYRVCPKCASNPFGTMNRVLEVS